MHQGKSLLAYLAVAAAPMAEAAGKSTTRTSTVTVFLPPRTTGSASNIYASVITSDSSKTEYLLACQTAFASPYSCDGDFKGVTVTYSAKTEMDVAFGASTYDCKLGSSAVCATKTASAASEGTTTLNASQSSAWMTAITVLDVDKTTTKKTSSKSASATSDSSVCKRATSNSGSSGSSSGSSNSGSSSSKSSSSSKTKKKNGGDSCSGAAKMSWDMGIVGIVGAGLAVAMAL